MRHDGSEVGKEMRHDGSEEGLESCAGPEE